jgi:hypothetical protein
MRRRRERIKKCCKLALTMVLVAAGTEIVRVSAPASGQTQPETIKGVLQLRIDDPVNKIRRNLRLDQAGAVPLKPRDRFRIEARLSRPAYAYLCWVGSDGQLAPIYPWTPGHWESRPEREIKITRLDLPAPADKAWEIPAGSPGIETLLLLIREKSPLSRGDEKNLAKLLSDSGASSSLLIKDAVWLENGREITLDPQDRALPSAKSRKSDDPVLRIRRLLSDKVQPLGDYWQALVFPNEGGK